MNKLFGFSLLLLLALAELPVTGADVRASFTGITEPIKDVTLSSPVAGIVGARLFQEGAFVRQGQPVIELDRKLEELETHRRKVIAERAKTDAEATRTLFRTSKSISEEELEKKEAEHKVAVADYEIASEQLRKRQIVSPVSGNIVEIFREVGEAVQANERLIRLVDTRQCYFVSNLDARVGQQLKLDQPINVEIDRGNTTLTIQGKIVFLSPVVDPASGLLKIKVLFDNPDSKIRPGVTGIMRLPATT